MNKKYRFVIRSDKLTTSVKLRTIRKHKDTEKGHRFWTKHGWEYRTGMNKIYPFVRWSKTIGGKTVWAKCVSATRTREVWRFETRSRYLWWSQIAPNWCHYHEWMEQGMFQAGYKLLLK